jgi:hypothetical protein
MRSREEQVRKEGRKEGRKERRKNMAEMRRTSFKKTEMDGQPWLLNNPHKVEISKKEDGNQSRLP